METCNLTERSCKPCEGGVPPMTDAEIEAMLAQVQDWSRVDVHIEKNFNFDNYYQTISFVNAVAWLSNQEGHHPNLDVGFRQCTVKYWTHAIGGLSENDFICAAKVDNLFK
ncbi:MAG: 4a-hydroxytetrahydrobiopterin dehydratase [Candidatus Latescibacteria bacterium]|nr:4a-hydroxytetrahydrobiopterin dehydratase [Candidatus Latescibacterota bacterium]